MQLLPPATARQPSILPLIKVLAGNALIYFQAALAAEVLWWITAQTAKDAWMEPTLSTEYAYLASQPITSVQDVTQMRAYNAKIRKHTWITVNV